MTPEMIFECLIVSEDRHVLSLMNNALERLSIDVETCATPAEGLELLADRDVDLVVCDYEGAPNDLKLLNRVLNHDDKRRKPTVLTVVDSPFLHLGAKGAGAHVVIQKPLTRESSAQGLKTAYSRMVREERRSPRRAIMERVPARNRCRETIQITITDVSEQGVGLFSRRKLAVGDLLSFDLLLPGTDRSFSVEVRLLWLRHNMAGAAFKRISSADRLLLHRWLHCKAKPNAKLRRHR
jgi:DNA-binding NarL/FixJ family response regulator